MAPPISLNPSRIQQLKTAFAEANAREAAKPLSQQIEEQAATPYYFAKGVGNWGLKLLESGQSLRPEKLLPQLALKSAMTAIDVENFINGKDSQIEKDLKETADKLTHPGRELGKAWEAGLNEATEAGNKFARMSHPQRMEAFGEIAPDVAAWLSVMGEVAGIATKTMRGTKALEVGIGASKLIENQKILFTNSSKIGSARLINADRALIDMRKITEYALNPNHPVGGNKAKVFESALGFNGSNAQDLVSQLKGGITTNDFAFGKVDAFGARFTVDIPVTGPSGSGIVRTGWMYKGSSNVPELTTLFVK